jgi:hypothetical protein
MSHTVKSLKHLLPKILDAFPMRSMRSDRIWDDGGEGELIGCHFDF